VSAVVYTGRLQGQTSAGAAITTINPVTLNGDGTLRWTDAAGVPRIAAVNGELAALIQQLFTGAGGYNTGRFVGKVPLTVPGSGGRTDP